jgi:hypothetical protein
MIISTILRPVMRAPRCGATLVVAAFLSVSTGAYADEPTLDELMNHFDSVVFGSEYEGVKPATQIQKWMTPIRVSITKMQGNMIKNPDGKRELKLV